MPRPPDLVVVIRAHNHRHLVCQSISAVIRSCQELSAPFEVVVVDHGSTDGTAATLRSILPWLPVLQASRLHSVGQAWWQGISWALERGARFILLLPGDMVVTPGALARLWARLENRPDLAGVDGRGPLLLRAGLFRQVSGEPSYNPYTGEIDWGRWLRRVGGRLQELREVTAIRPAGGPRRPASPERARPAGVEPLLAAVPLPWRHPALAAAALAWARAGLGVRLWALRLLSSYERDATRRLQLERSISQLEATREELRARARGGLLTGPGDHAGGL